MKLARRGFLRMMPTAAVAVRSAAEAAARDLSKVEIAGLGNSPYGSIASASGNAEDAAIAKALHVPHLRQEIESLFFENNRSVSRIDPDIAVLRSFSLNAKIAFQRQRNVAAELERCSGNWNYPYRKILKLVGIGG